MLNIRVMDTILGIKELYRELPAITREVGGGRSFVVVRHAKPVFRIEPIERIRKGTYTLKDVLKLRVKSKETNLSKRIDSIVYGV